MQSAAADFAPRIVHTGQHYDAAMSDAFFDDLGMPKPDVYLGVGSGSHAVQTARIMTAFEPVVLEDKPDWVVVVGDVNSTIACALVCCEARHQGRSRRGGPAVSRPHDAGGDQPHPDRLDLRPAAHDISGRGRESQHEGIPDEKIRFVGNVMIDSLMEHLKLAEGSMVRADLGIDDGEYAVVTLHRPSNVDDEKTFRGILDAVARYLKEAADRLSGPSADAGEDLDKIRAG